MIKSASGRSTDLQNARRLIELHGKDLRFVYAFKKWFFWDGQRWRIDDCGEVTRRATDVSRSLYQCAAAADSEDERIRFGKSAMSVESEGRINALVSLAKSQTGIAARPSEFDCDPLRLNTPKGIVDLQTGELLPHDQAAMCSKITGAGHAPGSRSDLWERCLETWLPDPEVRDFVQRAVGYSLIGSVTEQVLIILWGGGANGKSVFQEILRRALGDYAMHTPSDTLISTRNGGIPNDVARLRGARLVSASESDEGRTLAEAKIKSLTGGDTITARFMRAEFFEFTPTFTIWLSTNHKPTIRGQDLGIWRRIKLIPFEAQIPEEDRDPQLLERLKAELPAILTWMVEGCLEYQKHGLKAPHAVESAVDEYRRESDLIAEFVEDRCVVEPGRFASANGLYKGYQHWAREGGEPGMSKTMFGKKLTEMGFTQMKQGGERGRRGIALR